MKVEIIDDTHQRFNGVNYRRNKRGWYQTPNTALHRVVWEYHNGTIPKGYEIHHVDGDKANNQIENLQCVTRKEHRHLHVELDRAKGLIASPPKKYFICQKCGKEFSSSLDNPKLCFTCRAKPKKPKPEHVIKPFRPRRFRTCIVCGKVFELNVRQRHNGHKTCSPDCHEKFKHRIVEKACPICGKSFHPHHSWQKTCSPKCGSKLSGNPSRAKRVKRVVSACLWCGKKFEHRITQHPKFCSRACADTFRALTLRKDIKSYQQLRVCQHCGKSFVATKSSKKIFCSKECRRLALTQRGASGS
ncbi:MAG: HNH endonuclease [Selenomonadaceae bacterium]|nr:HNH endonuclease [Selenomonadaceae bacterium]